MSYTYLGGAHYKAKKDHRCDWCGEKISKGEKYSYSKGVFWGEFTTTKLHLECQIASEKSKFDDDEGWIPGQFKRGKTAQEFSAEF